MIEWCRVGESRPSAGPSMSDPTPDGRTTRRDFLRRSIALGASGLLVPPAGSARAEEPRLIVRSRWPLDAETPPEVLGREITPIRLFYVRSHFGAPAVGLTKRWSCEIVGGVRRPLSLSLDFRDRLAQVTIPAVLQCSGNGRAFYAPTVPGAAWGRGAVGNAEWTGVRLADLLEQAVVAPGMGHVHLHAADGPPMPKTPAYLRSIPLDRARAASTLLVTRMNGEPLPILHGGPIRLAVPGWSGNHWIKWLRTIVVARDEAPGPFMRTSYKMPLKPLPPGVDPKPDEVASITAMNVKSLIAGPSQGSVLRPGRNEIRGVAWTGGEAVVTKVEVSAGGDWRAATLEGEARPYAWRPWRLALDLAPGPLTLRARATDSSGATQPESSPWNRSGYLWNGYDRVTSEVRPA